MMFGFIKRVFRRRNTEPRRGQDVPFPELLKTGDQSFDEHCARAWEGERYDNLANWFLMKIKDIDDLNPTPEDLELLRRCRRNHILCDVLSRAISFGDSVQELQVNFSGAEVLEDSCRYNREPLVIPIAEYFSNPDVLPCRDCCSKGRKYCCMTIITMK